VPRDAKQLNATDPEAIMEMNSALFIRQIDEAGNGVFAPTSREQIAAIFRARAGGVDPGTADERTKAFYRASGFDWSLALG